MTLLLRLAAEPGPRLFLLDPSRRDVDHRVRRRGTRGDALSVITATSSERTTVQPFLIRVIRPTGAVSVDSMRGGIP